MLGCKISFHDLAICGGAPSFSKKLHVNRPNLGNQGIFLRHLDAILNSRQFSNNGPLLMELEQRLANFLSVKHCVVTNNGTTALALAMKALDLHGEVIIPSFSFISTAHTLLWQGIDPVFCDIDPTTWNIDPSHCESLITNKTTAIIATHLWGRSCEVSRLEDIARHRNLHLLFDAAHSFGCEYQGKKIGRFGDAEVFSFHATKVFHTFEGGALTTDNTALADNVRSIRNFGFTGYDQVEMLGTNAKMPEVCAAMGLTNLQSIDKFIAGNRQNYELYQQELNGINGLRLIHYDAGIRHNYQYIVLEVDEDIGLTRNQLMNILHAEQVMARRYFYPGNHRMQPYWSRYPQAGSVLPNTNLISQRVLLLPGGTGVTEDQIIEICAILRLAVSNAQILKLEINE